LASVHILHRQCWQLLSSGTYSDKDQACHLPYKPIVNELADDYAGRLIVGKVDVDSNPGIASKFGIRNIPTILFFKDGAVVEKHVGAAPKSTLAAKVDSIL